MLPVLLAICKRIASKRSVNQRDEDLMSDRSNRPSAPTLYRFPTVDGVMPVVTWEAWKAYIEFLAGLNEHNDWSERMGRRIIAAGVMTFWLPRADDLRHWGHSDKHAMLELLIKLGGCTIIDDPDNRIYVPFMDPDLIDRDLEEGYSNNDTKLNRFVAQCMQALAFGA